VAQDEAERRDAVYKARDRNGSDSHNGCKPVRGQTRLPFEPPDNHNWAHVDWAHVVPAGA
jgi:hypothetical protein